MDLIFRNERLTFPEARNSSTKQRYFRVVLVRYRFFNEIAETPRNVKSSVPRSTTFERGSNALLSGHRIKTSWPDASGTRKDSKCFARFGKCAHLRELFRMHRIDSP